MSDIKIGKWRVLVPHAMKETARCAVCDLSGIVGAYLPYPLAVSDETQCTPEQYDENLIIMGTTENGFLCRTLAERGFFTPETKKEGYSVRVAASPYHAGRQIILLCGADDAGLLYAVHAFDRFYLCSRCRYHGYHYNHAFEAFLEEMPAWEYRTAPKTDNRGVWSWGHMIFDYRGFLRNMSALGMNLLVVWNDFAPLNAKEVLNEAHRRGIRIFWGFSCSWGETVDPCDPRDVEKWCARVLDTYTREYEPLGGDGIYFQAFTETHEREIGGRPIAALVTDWANAICNTLHGAYPSLEIQFGVHATSIGGAYPMLSGIDPDVPVMWEDCGDFPYAYDPAQQKNSAEALRYTQQLLRLNGDQTRFAAVLKGFTLLNWSRFEHYHGPIVLGEYPDAYIRDRLEKRMFTWQYARPYWMQGAGILKEFFRITTGAGIRETTVAALIEDGMLEREIDPCVSLFAALMWDWDRDTEELIADVQRAAQRDYHASIILS